MNRRLVAGSLAAGAAQVAALTLLSRVVGFGRWAVFEPTVGSGAVGSAYSSANLLPTVLFEVLAGGALLGCVVPLLAGALARGRDGAAEADRTASALLCWVLLVLVPVAVVVALAAGPLARAALGGGDELAPGQVELARRLLVVFAAQVPLYGVGVVLTGVLAARRRFVAAAVTPLLSSVVVIAAYGAFAAVGGPRRRAPATVSPDAEAVLAWGTTAGVAALTLPLLVPVARAGVRLRPTLCFPPGVAARARRLAAAGLAGLVAQQVSVVVVLLTANRIDAAGAHPVVLYAQAVHLLPFGVLVVPVVTVAFPRLAAAAATADTAGFARTASVTTRAVVLAAAAGAASLLAAAPAVQDFFVALGGGAGVGGPVSPDGAVGEGSALGGLGGLVAATAPALLGLALLTHLGRALYALERGRSAAVATVGGWLLVAALSPLALVGGAGTAPALERLGLATSAGMLVGGALALLALRRWAGADSLEGVPRTLVAALGGAALGAAAARALAAALPDAVALAGSGGGPSAVVVAALAAGLAGAVAVAVLAAVVAAADRSSLTAVLALAGARRAARAGAR